MIHLENDELKTIRDLCYDRISEIKQEIKDEKTSQSVKECLSYSIEKMEKLKLYINSKIEEDY